MSRDAKEFEISKLLQLAEKEKYATTVAAFEVIDKLEQIDIPKKYTNRKPAVKAMIALSDGIVQYDYIADEARQALLEELHGPGATSASPTAEIAAARGRVPVVEESEEDLGDEDIGEIEPTAKLDEDSEDGDESEAADEEEEEDEDEEDSDDDDDEEDSEPEDD
ncbi:MAG TPA: DNA primase [Leptospiraceae bacterium]|jgi:TATA-binding protein-associated factor Taf7|nr:DNA primase [Leptospirales bacterium]HMU84470.1 DNA primase [Leptospiraceae bacterium]HMW58108.1 DNA primase [Leptospiraceae bacterium]HMX58022.1 DNA primase [Leptospiraceae bacterium]HMY47225.1 DNA primase [Leptospiraceae bacterium]